MKRISGSVGKRLKFPAIRGNTRPMFEDNASPSCWHEPKAKAKFVGVAGDGNVLNWRMSFRAALLRFCYK